MCSDVVKLNREVMLTWIIPVEKYIAQAIESILNQPCQDFEIIVVDDGSKDTTADIVQKYLSDWVSLIRKENGGVSSARNYGIEAAKSTYIAFLDADDTICRNAYDEQIRSLLQEGKYDLISFSYFSGDEDLKYGNLHSVIAGESQCVKLQRDPFKHCSSFVYHRRLFDGEQPLRFPEGIKIREDVAFQFLVYQQADTVLNVDRKWFIYRNNIASVLHQSNSSDYIINHAIPAWKWSKDKCTCIEAKQHCDCRIFAEVTEYIRLSCMEGIALDEVRKVLTLPTVCEALSHYDILWGSRKKEYEAFLNNPQKYKIKRRLVGIVTQTVRFLVRIPFFRKIYFRLKYKERIAPFV